MRFLKEIFYYRFSSDKNFVQSLSSILGYVPTKPRLYKLAFSHKSMEGERSGDDKVQNNERLEYLGDAVLGTIVAEYLFKKYPNKDEGFLTKMRSKIVNRKCLNGIADKMELDVFLRQSGTNTISRSMLGNALEALIGAVYIERGYGGTRQFIVFRILRHYLEVEALESIDRNFKSQLLEWCQKSRKTIAYQILDKFKMDNRDRFKVAVLIDDEQIATAEDFSKKSAEQLASEKALKIIRAKEPIGEDMN